MMQAAILTALMAGLVALADDVRKARARLGSWMPALELSAGRYSLSPHVLVALFWNESRCNPEAVGSAGEVGLGQMMPIAAEDIGVDISDIRNNPEAQIDAAAKYLRLLLDRTGGDLFLAIRGYNAGLARARRDPSQSMLYLARIYSMALIGVLNDFF